MRAAANQLVHPINIVLPELAPSAGILCTSKVTYSNQRCCIEMRWSARNKTVAILEFKNAKVLNKSPRLHYPRAWEKHGIGGLSAHLQRRYAAKIGAPCHMG